tara:strand:- start:7587 stop:11330 length:3744 start_codon:yes stop_codon:yes gene_type:complete
MLFKRLKKYCHYNYKLFLFSFLLLLFACEESVEKTVNSSDSTDQSLENTLDNSLSGQTGNINNYFYDLDCEQINAKYYRYDHNAMENPQFYFDELSDTLNFLTFPDYLTSIDSGAGQYNIGEEFVDMPNGVYDEGEEYTDSNGNGLWDTGEPFTDIGNGVWDEGEEFSDSDFLLTNRVLESAGVQHVEGEVSIETQTYFNIQKFEWNEEEGRYQAYPQPGPSQETTYIFDQDLGLDQCPDTLEDGSGGCLSEDDDLVYDETTNPDPNSDNYDEETNVSGTQGDGIYNGNGIYDEGEEFVDSNNNGSWDVGEVYFDTIGGNSYIDIYSTKEYRVNYDLQSLGFVDGIYYIDEEEWVTTDSIYSSSNYTFQHTFTLQKDVVSADSLMWVVSTDCNENNMRDAEAERYVSNIEDCNGVNEIFISDPEPFDDFGEDGCEDIFESGDGQCQDIPNYGEEYERYTDMNDDGSYDSGELFVDSEPFNGIWDAAEPFTDSGNGQYDLGEDYIDLGNGLFDEGEDYTDSNGNGLWDTGEPFTDKGDCEYTPAEEFVDCNPSGSVCQGDSEWDSSLGNGIWDAGEDFTDLNGNGLYDFAEEYIDSIGNGVWDEGEDFTDLNGNSLYDTAEDFTDSNGNGLFDYPETVFDTGSDNCFDEFEDGLGGCNAEGGASGDPNGDNYDIESNSSGTEGNGGAPDELIQACADPFEDGQGGCLDSVDPDYFSGDPNGDNDINNDNYSQDNNQEGTEGNGLYEDGEPFTDQDEGTIEYDLGFCDRTNNIFDPSEVHLDLEEEGEENEQWDSTEPFQDRNCNEVFDLGEQKSPDIDQDYCENIIGGIWVGGVEEFDFCDIGNGVYDLAELCIDGSENCNSSQLYKMSDRPNSLVVSYENESPEPFLVILPGQSIQNRWGLSYESLIETIDFSDTQFESVPLIDSIVTVHSNPIIQQLELDSPTDYYIAKSVWNDGGREYDYHMFRQGDDGYIYRLANRSYFLPAGFYGAYDEGGFWFEDNASEDVYLYTVDGELRDGERIQTSRIDSTGIAEYLVQETYEVDFVPVTVPMRQTLGVNHYCSDSGIACTPGIDADGGESGQECLDGSVCEFTGEVSCYFNDEEGSLYYLPFPDYADISDCPADTTFDDCFKVTKEKTTTMFGTGIEYVESSETFFVKDYGIVKDDVEFRWNTAPGYENDLEGQFRWEMVADRDADNCDEAGFLQSLINNKESVRINSFNGVSDFNYDPYIKSRTYGLQRIFKEGGSQ